MIMKSSPGVIKGFPTAVDLFVQIFFSYSVKSLM